MVLQQKLVSKQLELSERSTWLTKDFRVSYFLFRFSCCLLSICFSYSLVFIYYVTGVIFKSGISTHEPHQCK